MKYVCATCGAEFLKWSGRCPSCGEWGTLEESSEEKKDTGSKQKSASAKYSELISTKKTAKSYVRRRTGIGEFDRVLGGGFMDGEVILVSGEPGVGKSTLLLQVALNLAQKERILYIAGEESPNQLKSRVERLLEGMKEKETDVKNNLFVTDEIDVDKLESLISSENFGLVIVDSIQSLVSNKSKGYSGSIGQVRVSGAVLTRVAKETSTPMLMVGQINKVGNIAGPKVLEHIVDCVLYFEGEEFNQYRILRGMKNRFGSTNEIGVFEMTSFGLKEIGNPSLVFLDKTNSSSGSAIGAVLQGSRVVFVEVQALVADREYEGGPLRRVANGIKKPRLDMLCAVLSRKGNIFLGDKDVFVNVVGGLTVNDPSIDLAVCAAIKSAVKDIVLEKDSIYFGEVGLTGEVRGLWGFDSVVSEASRVGYKSIVAGKVKGSEKNGLEIRKVLRISSL